MLPSMFGENLFDDWGPDFGHEFFGKGSNLMKTDVKESDDNYVLSIDLPGCKKEDVKIQFENGTLSVTASKSREQDDQDEKGNYIRKERYAGSCSRQFYVGRDIRKESISAKMNDGVLTLTIPKKSAEEIEESTRIAITD